MNGSKATVRSCNRNDIEDVIRIEHACYPSEEALGVIAVFQYFDLFSDAFGVVELSSTVVGYSVGGIAMAHETKVGWLLSIAVLPQFRGQQFGANVAKFVIDKLLAAKVTKIRATVSPDNDHSIRLLRKLGFSIIDDIPNYFGDKQRRFLVETNNERRTND